MIWARWCRAFLRAVWAEERDISDDAVIRDLLGGCVVSTRHLADKGPVRRRRNLWPQSGNRRSRPGAFGAPFYVVRETRSAVLGVRTGWTFLDRHLATL